MKHVAQDVSDHRISSLSPANCGGLIEARSGVEKAWATRPPFPRELRGPH